MRWLRPDYQGQKKPRPRKTKWQLPHQSQTKPLKNELARTKTLANNSHIKKQRRLYRTLTEPSEGGFTFSQPDTLAAKDPKNALDEMFNCYVHHDFKHVATPEGQLT